MNIAKNTNKIIKLIVVLLINILLIDKTIAYTVSVYNATPYRISVYVNLALGDLFKRNGYLIPPGYTEIFGKNTYLFVPGISLAGSTEEFCISKITARAYSSDSQVILSSEYKPSIQHLSCSNFKLVALIDKNNKLKLVKENSDEGKKAAKKVTYVPSSK